MHEYLTFSSMDLVCQWLDKNKLVRVIAICNSSSGVWYIIFKS